MTSGKRHAVVGILSCIAAWILISLIHLYWSGLLIGLIFGAILAKFPDLDIDIRIIFSHRNPILHSALLPGLILIIAIWVREFTFLELVIYWCVAHGSHLLADMLGKPSNHVTWYFLLGNGVLLISMGLLAGVYILI